MAKKLRVGLIGVGGIAGAHFPGWDASPFAEVVALGDINPETLARVGQQRGIDRHAGPSPPRGNAARL